MCGVSEAEEMDRVGRLSAVTYANRTQANATAAKYGVSEAKGV